MKKRLKYLSDEGTFPATSIEGPSKYENPSGFLTCCTPVGFTIEKNINPNVNAHNANPPVTIPAINPLFRGKYKYPMYIGMK